MADVVDKRVDSMMSEIDDLERKGLFSKLELRQIVLKRTQFEYGLLKTPKRRKHFDDYIAYEIKLDRLRELRKKRLGVPKKRTESDFAPVRRIQSIYCRAVLKFPENIDLWNEYIEYLKENDASKALSKAFADILKIHSTKPEVWISAAEWEARSNGDIQAARNILQRALRVNKVNTKAVLEEIYLCFIRLEVEYVEKLRERASIFGDPSLLEPDEEEEDEQTSSQASSEAKESQPSLLSGSKKRKRSTPSSSMLESDSESDGDSDVENPSAHISIDAEGASSSVAEKDGENASEVRKASRPKKRRKVLDKAMGGAVPKFLYDRAVNDAEPDLSFHQKVIAMTPSTEDFASLRQYVVSNAERLLGYNPEFWTFYANDLLARSADSGVDEKTRENEAFGVFDRATKIYPQAAMFDAYSKHIASRLELATSDGRGSEIVFFLSKHHAVYKRASKKKALTFDIMQRQASMYLQIQKPSKAAEVAQKATEQFPASAMSWCLLADVLLQEKSTADTSEDLDAVIRRGLSNVTDSNERALLWKKLIDVHTSVEIDNEASKKRRARLRGVFEESLHGSEGTHLEDLATAYLAWSLQQTRADKAALKSIRFVFKQLTRTPPVSLFRKLLGTATSFLADIGDKADRASLEREIRGYFEQALSIHGESAPDLWEDYAMFETSRGHTSLATNIRWRASKALRR